MLFSLKKILVCVDLREDCQEFLKNVEKLRSKAGTSVDVVYVNDVSINIEWVSPYFKEDDYYSSFMGEMKRLVSGRLKEAIEKSGLKGKAIILEGKPVEEILQICENYDLMIIG